MKKINLFFVLIVLFFLIFSFSAFAIETGAAPQPQQLPLTEEQKKTQKVEWRVEVAGTPSIEYYNELTKKGDNENQKNAKVKSYLKELEKKQDDLKKELNKLGIKINSSFMQITNTIFVTATEEEAQKILELPWVESVSRAPEVKLMLQDSVPLINADDVWQLKDSLDRNITGQGVKVAIIDTGVDYTHPDLGGCFGSGCKVEGGWDFAYNDADPTDGYGHGTHVAGIIAGNGYIKGVAPGATIYAYKIFDDTGHGAGSYEAALEKVADPNGDGDYSDHLDVLNMSLGFSMFGVPLTNPDDSTALAADRLCCARRLRRQ